MPWCYNKSKKRDNSADRDAVKYEPSAPALPAPKLFGLKGRVVVKLLVSKNAGSVIQTIGRVNRGDISSAYIFEPSILGIGQNGQIRSATDKYSGRKFAVKSFIKGIGGKEKVNLFRNEAQVFLKLDHPHVARLLEVWEDSSAVHFVMEYCNGGDLVTWVMNRKMYPANYQANEALARVLVSQMVRTILYMHTQHIVHRDIKPDHWLIDGLWSRCGTMENVPFIKLIDFGLSRTYSPDSRMMKATCGTLPYSAPEVLLGSYSTQCDMWSLGVSMYFLITGEPLFYGAEEDMATAIISGPRCRFPKRVAKQVSAECNDFLFKLLMRDPNDRLTARAAFDHAWLIPPQRLSPSSITSRLITGNRLFVELPRALSLVPESNFFRQVVLAMMGFGLTSEQMLETRDLFLLLDESGDGIVTYTALHTFLSKLDPGFTEEQCNKISRGLDVFNRGGIYFNDFISSLLGSFLPMEEASIRSTFWKFDRARSGQVTVECMREVLGTVYGDRVLERFLREADRDGDKNIDFDEFVHILDPAAFRAGVST